MENNLDCQSFFGHSLHGAMMLDVAAIMHANFNNASFESVNVFGCPNIMRYFILPVCAKHLLP